MKLPLKCDVTYYESFLSPAESAEIFDWICAHCPDLEWEDITLANGMVHRMDTGKWMFVDEELTDFSLFFEAHGRRMAWPPIMRSLKDKVEQFVGMAFHVCVCIYYRSGDVGVGFHSDLRSFGSTSLIPSISLGAERTFLFRRKSDHSEQFEMSLANGSLLIMGDGCQDEYEHSVPVCAEVLEPRINLTFRPFNWPKGHKRFKKNGEI